MSTDDRISNRSGAQGSGMPRVVIVGGGFGGLAAAKALGKASVQVILIDRTNHHVFQPLLYQVATSVLTPGQIAWPIRNILRKQQNTTVIMGEVTGVDKQQKLVFANTADRVGLPVRYDFLILATGARHAYEILPGSREYAYSVCDPTRILQTREAVLNFKGGEFFAGVGAGYTPCDGPPMEILMDMDHFLRQAGIRDKTRLHYISDKECLLPPGGPEVWTYLDAHFAKREIIVHKEVQLVKLDQKTLYFKDGKTMPYDMCVLVPPYRGIEARDAARARSVGRGGRPTRPLPRRAPGGRFPRGRGAPARGGWGGGRRRRAAGEEPPPGRRGGAPGRAAGRVERRPGPARPPATR